MVATDIRARVRPHALIPSSIYCFIEPFFSFFISLFHDNKSLLLRNGYNVTGDDDLVSFLQSPVVKFFIVFSLYSLSISR